MNHFIASISLALMVTSLHAAESALLIEERSVTTQAAGIRTTVKKAFYSSNHALIQDTAMPYDVLFNYSTATVFIIDHQSRTYSRITLGRFIEMARTNPFAALKPSDILIDSTRADVSIGGQAAVRYVYTIPRLGVKTEMAVSRQRYDLSRYFRFAEKVTGMSGPSAINDIYRSTGGYSLKAKTFPVSTRAPMMQVETDLVRLETIAPRSGLFSVPAGYAETPLR